MDKYKVGLDLRILTKMKYALHTQYTLTNTPNNFHGCKYVNNSTNVVLQQSFSFQTTFFFTVSGIWEFAGIIVYRMI